MFNRIEEFNIMNGGIIWYWCAYLINDIIMVID